MGLLLGSQSSEVGSGNMAAGGQDFTKSSDDMGPVLSVEDGTASGTLVSRAGAGIMAHFKILSGVCKW